MHPDLEKLIPLQKYDLEAKRLHDANAALPRQVAALGAKAEAVATQRSVVAKLLKEEEALRRRQELEIKEHSGKIARLARQLDSATSAVQVTAFEHQIAFSRAELSRIEDAELESMGRTEEMEAQMGRADLAVAEAESALKDGRERAAGSEAANLAALELLEQKRAALRPQIGAATLARYDAIARAKGTALAEASHQRCSACQMLVRPQRWNDLRDRSLSDEIMLCESCGRMLFYDPARDAPVRDALPEESIAARIVRSL